MRSTVFLLFAAFLIWPVWAATKKSTTKSGTKSSTSTRKKASSKKRAPRAPATTWRNRQLKPSQERYAEIQQALVDKGYLQSEPDGNWNDACVDALRKFQQDQNLDASGKIDSLSLIALGLGPKYETAKASAEAPPAEQQ